MASINRAVQWAINIANDDTHGYDQTSRLGPDYDCSSFVCTALNQAGFNIAPYNTTSTMLQSLISIGFRVVQAPFKKGDIHLAVGHHTAMQINSTQLVQASENEHGTATGGQTGDQTGREIWITNYYDYPWDYHLRYENGDEPSYDFVHYISYNWSTVLTQEEIDNNILATYERMSAYGWGIGAIVGMCACMMVGTNINPGSYIGASSSFNFPYYDGRVGMLNVEDMLDSSSTNPNPLMYHAQQEGRDWYDGDFQCWLATKANDIAYTSMGLGQGARWGWKEATNDPQDLSTLYPSVPFAEYVTHDGSDWSSDVLYWYYCFETHYFDPYNVQSVIPPRHNAGQYAYDLITQYAPKPVKKRKGMPIWMMLRYSI